MHVKPENAVAGRTCVMCSILRIKLKCHMTEMVSFTNGDDFNV